jgi:hypothetical protein
MTDHPAKGGKVLFTGRSALGADGKPLFNVGAEVAKESEFSLDYILPIPELRPSFAASPLVIYCRYPRLKVTTGTALGEVVEPYFERAWNHFCSHQHAPQRRQGTGFACGVQQGNVIWLPMDLCLAYRKWGAGDDEAVLPGLPAPPVGRYDHSEVQPAGHGAGHSNRAA